MSTDVPQQENAAERDQFQRHLSKKRTEAEDTGSYSSQETRRAMSEEFKKRTGGKEPYKWQLDVAEALLLKIDCIAIAGTGAGKTMPFFMPLLVDGTGKKKVIIVSALNALQDDQARRFREYGLSATAVNSQTWNSQLSRDLLANKYQIILCGPEMMLEHAEFSKMLRTPAFTNDVIAIIVDEAHCISQWGHQFRKHYGQLETLRSYVPLEIPFLATSATITPNVLIDIQRKLQISKDRMFFVNLGNDRPNLTPIVAFLKSSSDIDALNCVVDEALHNEELIPTIIYVNTRDLAHTIWEHLSQLVPESYRRQIGFIHARRDPRAKKWVMEQFRKGKIKVLIATDVAGMGMDITHIIRVMQFLVPGSLSELIQHLGRAGRSGQPAIVVLFVEPSVFKRIRKRGTKKGLDSVDKAREQPMHAATRKRPFDEVFAMDGGQSEDDEEEAGASNAGSDYALDDSSSGREDGVLDPALFQYQKKVEDGLRDWIETSTCRRTVVDQYFNNPRREQLPPVPCCDVCVMRKYEDRSNAMTDAELEIYGFIGRLGIRDPWATPPPSPETPPATRTKRKDGDGARRKERLQNCRDALLSWRRWCWNQNYKHCAWSFDVLLPDKELEVLAKSAHIRG